MRLSFWLVAILFICQTAQAQQSSSQSTTRRFVPGSAEEQAYKEKVKRVKLLREKKRQKLLEAGDTEGAAKLAPRKKKTEEADDVITNKKMAAEAGSKSKFSLASSLAYNGGTVEKPFAADRPNIKGAAVTPSITSISGQISGKWNMTKVDSLFLGIGVKMLAPFESKLPEKARERYGATDPYLTYQRLAKIYGVQTVIQAGGIWYTDKQVRADGSLAEAGLSLTLAYDFGGSPFTMGISLGSAYRFFDKETSEVIMTYTDKEDDSTVYVLAGASQDDYSLAYFPFIEYQLNDTFNFRTLIGFMYDHARVEDNPMAYKKNKVYQSVGIGISITRDIYLYPNIQFLPDDVRSDLTNVALSASINLF